MEEILEWNEWIISQFYYRFDIMKTFLNLQYIRMLHDRHPLRLDTHILAGQNVKILRSLHRIILDEDVFRVVGMGNVAHQDGAEK